MDPSTHLPDITEAHIAHAANPTPSHGPNHNHPPYAEMIAAAITALKERNGSSRRAIAKYIEGVYTNLPPTHSALLTHHLKRLKNHGHLVMVKHSYKLPRSESSGTASIPKRGRGRPPKPKPGTEPMLVALGLVDEPITVPNYGPKRGPGRPPKVNTASVGTELGGLMLRGHGRPPKPKLVSGELGPVRINKGRGRPPKPRLMSEVLSPGGIKRGRGRPPKPHPMPMINPYGPYLSNVPRPRGRPKKDGSSRAKAPGRPRIRLQKNVNALSGGVVLGTRRGRPPKVAGAKKPKKGSGRPVGRPRKNNALPAEAPQWMVDYGYIKSKLEYFQSRIKQAVGVLKPHLTNENAVSAVAALQELEEISTMDIISAPLHQQHVQGQEQPMPQPQNDEGQEPVIQNQEPH